MSAWSSAIPFISNGFLNTVNDSVVANQPSIGGTSRFQGQLGKHYEVSSEQIGQLFDPAVGTLYAGHYQYVQLASTSSAIVRGNMLYWNQAVAPSLFQTILSPTSGITLTAAAIAGVALNVITPGNYGWIFVGAGWVQALYIASITGTKATGRPVFVSTGTPNRVDIIDTDPATTPEVWNTYLGYAVTLPTDNSIGTIAMSPRPLRG